MQRKNGPDVLKDTSLLLDKAAEKIQGAYQKIQSKKKSVSRNGPLQE
jgi:hypothetical protein